MPRSVEVYIRNRGEKRKRSGRDSVNENPNYWHESGPHSVENYLINREDRETRLHRQTAVDITQERTN
jgi:hypothetical protein